MKAAFVTATGTDIGKTFCTAGIIRALRAAGRDARAIKPVMSGYDPAAPEASDAGMLLAALGQAATPENVAAISPWRFAAPLSPDMAAAREGRAIPLPELAGFCRAAIAGAGDLLLVEGVGGVLVPLDDRHTVRDWIEMLDLPALLVTGSHLGTISHTLAAAEALLKRGQIAAILLNESETSPVPPAETAECIGRFLPCIPIRVIPRNGGTGFRELGEFLLRL